MVKLLIAGPKQAGKTSIANFLSDNSRSKIGDSAAQYEPTAGCRILEFDASNGASVELWDVSGDQQYENCWPAICQGVDKRGSPDSETPVDGVILVYNPEFPTHDTEVGLWYDAFVKNCNLPDSKCLVFTHRGDPKGGFRSRPPPKLEGCVVHNTTFTSTLEIREHFENFLQSAVGGSGMRRK
ncbi:hypothetical protein TrRE_jg6376 [Triparma retinervis]|uniref:Intraflagellar transport protein 22 homolog n=1 Tax=Triparma retinervis TaxID=2557542 RepID=A0A9W7L4U6_9STRA|nr:hypothetical protein TrRE_jg6376 [Triparma retinervis]